MLLLDLFSYLKLHGRESNLGLRACKASTLPVKLDSQPLKRLENLDLVSS